MINILLIILIALSIYNIIVTLRVNSLERDMANVKKFIYAQQEINVMGNEIHSLTDDRLTALEEKEVNEDDN